MCHGKRLLGKSLEPQRVGRLADASLSCFSENKRQTKGGVDKAFGCKDNEHWKQPKCAWSMMFSWVYVMSQQMCGASWQRPRENAYVHGRRGCLELCRGKLVDRVVLQCKSDNKRSGLDATGYRGLIRRSILQLNSRVPRMYSTQPQLHLSMKYT